MDINSKLYLRSARALRLPLVVMENEIDGFQIMLSGKKYFFRGGNTPFNDNVTSSIAENKFCMNIMLRQNGFPLPKSITISRNEIQNDTFDLGDLKFPVVAKPTRGTAMGKDVLCNIKNLSVLKDYLHEHKLTYNFITVEEFKGGLNSYRVLVFFGKVIGVVKRIPAHLVGDGSSTILELVRKQNIKRKKLKKKVSLGNIKLDTEVDIKLDELGLKLDTVLSDGEEVTLCYGCNSTRGGTMVSLEASICPENAELLCDAAKTLNLNIVGFDLLCKDIMLPISTSEGYIIEANHNPDISIHENPLSGTPLAVTKIILSKLIYKHPFAYVRLYFSMVTSSLFSRVVFIIAVLVIFYR